MILLRHARVGRRANLWADWPHREPVVTGVDVSVVAVRTEVESEGVGVVDRAVRTRPVVAHDACTAEPGTVAVVARGRQEDGVAVRAVHLIAVHAVLCGPCPGAVV